MPCIIYTAPPLIHVCASNYSWASNITHPSILNTNVYLPLNVSIRIYMYPFPLLIYAFRTYGMAHCPPVLCVLSYKKEGAKLGRDTHKVMHSGIMQLLDSYHRIAILQDSYLCGTLVGSHSAPLGQLSADSCQIAACWSPFSYLR